MYQELSLQALNWWVSVRKLPQMELITAEVHENHVKFELHKNVAISQKRHPTQTTLVFLKLLWTHNVMNRELRKINLLDEENAAWSSTPRQLKDHQTLVNLISRTTDGPHFLSNGMNQDLSPQTYLAQRHLHNSGSVWAGAPVMKGSVKFTWISVLLSERVDGGFQDGAHSLYSWRSTAQQLIQRPDVSLGNLESGIILQADREPCKQNRGSKYWGNWSPGRARVRSLPWAETGTSLSLKPRSVTWNYQIKELAQDRLSLRL